MTRLVEVRRISVVMPFDYPLAKVLIEDAYARGDVVTIEREDLVIRTKVFVRGRGAA